MGHVDELNCCLGLLLAVPLPDGVHAALAPCQHELFNLGGELSMPPAALVASITVSAPSSPCTRSIGAATPVEVSLCGHA